MFHVKQKKVISIVNQKGGVGKTTTSLNAATALAVMGKKVLAVDFDPQGNLSSGFGLNNSENNVYKMLVNGLDVNDCIYKTKIKNLDIITSNMDLSAFELDVYDKEEREFFLKKKLYQVTDKYDYVIIDCPPSLSFLTINALCISDYVLVPLQCEFFALEGLSHLLETLDRIKGNFNPKLSILGVLLTMYDKRNRLTEQVENDVRSCLSDLVFDTVIPRNVKLTESTSFGVPTIIYDQHCAGSIAYINFVKEMVKKI